MLELLKWDSEFFGFKVGRWEIMPPPPKDILSHILSNVPTGMRLVYLQSPTALQNLPENIHLVDRKTVYTKTLYSASRVNNASTAQPWSSLMNRMALDHLAIQAGFYSRFAVDPQMPAGSLERLYRLWIQRSVDKELADEVLVIANENVPIAMITVTTKSATGHVGLVAVDDAHRGKGLGRCLLQAAESWCATNGAKSMQIITQGGNIPACHLYESTGYKICKQDFLYHMWLQPKLGGES